MSEPILEQAEAYWETRLKTISVANGYRTDPVTVSRRIPSFGELQDPNLPGLYIASAQVVVEPAFIGAAKKSVKVSLTLSTTIVAADATGIGTLMARMKTDVIRCLVLDFMFGGLLYTAPTNISWNADLEGKYLPKVVAQLNFTVTYQEDLT